MASLPNGWFRNRSGSKRKTHDLPIEVLTDRKQITCVFNDIEAASSYGFAGIELDLVRERKTVLNARR